MHMLGLGGLGGLGGLLGGVTDSLEGVRGAVVDAGESLSPGFGSGFQLTGNILGNNGAVDDLLTNLGEGDVSGAVAEVYGNVIGPGGIIHNLADGYGLGVEGLIGQVLGTTDGLLGGSGGLLDGLLG
jgi:hypothetical protein